LKEFGKYTVSNFVQNRFSGSRVVPCGRIGRRTDTHDEAESRFSKFF